MGIKIVLVKTNFDDDDNDEGDDVIIILSNDIMTKNHSESRQLCLHHQLHMWHKHLPLQPGLDDPDRHRRGIMS